jgi:hypothetical protein
MIGSRCFSFIKAVEVMKNGYFVKRGNKIYKIVSNKIFETKFQEKTDSISSWEIYPIAPDDIISKNDDFEVYSKYDPDSFFEKVATIIDIIKAEFKTYKINDPDFSERLLINCIISYHHKDEIKYYEFYKMLISDEISNYLNR